MASKVFDKKIPHYCEYCVHGTASEYSNEVICIKKGITDKKDSCRRYKYDPLKRTPATAKLSDNYKPEDFLI